MSDTPNSDAGPESTPEPVAPADEPTLTELPPADPLFGDPAPAPAGSAGGGKGTGWVTWAVAAGVVALVVAGGIFLLGRGGDDTAANDQALSPTFGAAAGGPTGSGGPGGGTFGTISAIDGDTLTVERQGFPGADGSTDTGTTSEVTVQTDGDTVVTESVEATLADLAEGDQVVVFGETGDDGTVAATSVAESGDLGQPGDGQGGTLGEAPDGAVLGYGQAPPSGQAPSDASGYGPPADGTGTGTDGAPTGGPPSGAGFAGGAPTFGTVTSVDGGTLTLEAADGSTVTVTTDADTTVTILRTLTVADLEVGDQVAVQGDGASTGSSDPIVATSIRVGDAGTGFIGGPGGGAPPGATATAGATTDTTVAP